VDGGIDRIISILAALTLTAMMVATGLTVRRTDLRATFVNRRLVTRVALANYVAVPAITVALLAWLRIDPGVAAGFLVLAVCPGAPFGPAVAAVARGDVASATGLMVVLAGSSALLAPLLLPRLLPLGGGMEGVRIDAMAVAGTLLVTQLLPLFAAVVFHERRPDLAARLRPLAGGGSRALGAATGALVFFAHAGLLLRIRMSGVAAMVILLALSLGAGWWAGRGDAGLRRAAALTTSLRNVGAALAITGSAFAGTAAATAVIAYFFVEVLGSLAVALWWRTAGTA
jgi:BASS family bile acid:Na+ symporter